MRKKYLLLSAVLTLLLAFCSGNVFADEASVPSDEVVPEVTSVSASSDVVEWEDQITIEINYTSPDEPGEINLTYLPVNVFDGDYHEYLSGHAHEMFTWQSKGISNNLMVNDSNEAYYEEDYIKVIENTFDKNTGKGKLKYKRKIKGWDGEGGNMKLFRAELCFNHGFVYNGTNYGYYYDLAIPEQGTGLYEAVTPVGSPVFNIQDSDPDFIERLSSLRDGELAVVRPLTHQNLSSPETGTYSLTDFYKAYFDAIEGKNVTLIVMAGAEDFMVINGRDIVNDTKDVKFGLGFSMRGKVENGKMNITAHVACPDNGILPCKIRYYENYERYYDLFARVFNDGDERYELTREDFDHDLRACKIYYVNNGVLTEEDASIQRDGKWFYYDLEHNSKFIATNADPSTIRSFTATLKKELTYTGKKLKPTVTVSCLKGTSYNIKYDTVNSKNVGTYAATIRGTKGGYGALVIKYKIIPKGTTIKTLIASKKKCTVKWKKQSAKMSRSHITGYQIQAATDSKFTKDKRTVNAAGYSQTSKKISGLKANKTYYVHIRTYLKTGGKTYYSNWSKKQKVKIK